MTEAGQRLLQAFETIYRTRMAGMPMVNPALCVAVVGFDHPEYAQLGILITPWSMNLVLLPQAQEDWSTLKPGSKQLHIFPSGCYEFVVGDEPGLGRYQMCSLFSPMFEFHDQATAEATAQAALAALVEGQQAEQAPSPQGKAPLSRRAFVSGGLLR